MEALTKIIKCYDKIADNYAVKFQNELNEKHLDRLLLTQFAALNVNKGLMADFGCGPGQTTKFLCNNGVKNIIGIDISSGMIDNAKKLFPEINFETGNMLALSYPVNYFGSAVAFYSIVNFTYDQIETAFKEINRVLKNKAHFLFCFHVGEEVVHHNSFLEKDVDIDFYFLQTEKILELLKLTGFHVIDAIERIPYKDIEYPSKRAYVWVEKL